MPRVKGGKVFTPSSEKLTLALPPERYFRGRSNHFSKMGLLDRMDEAISADQWKLLKESRLGGIVMIGHNVSYCCALIHYFLERQLKTLKKGETWYEIQGRLLRFSMKEFCIVTGLNCAHRVRDFEAEDHKDALKRLFGRDKVKVKDLIVMREVAKAQERSDMRRFKLALLLIVEGILLPGDMNRNVKGWVVCLVEDVDRFLKYPWGRVVYEVTHESLEGALMRRVEVGMKEDNERTTYTLNGFPLAFQVWMYEVVPGMRNVFANRISGVSHPRCVRWRSTDSYIPYERVKRLMDEETIEGVKSKDARTILVPAENEKELVSCAGYTHEAPDDLFDKAAREFEVAHPTVVLTQSQVSPSSTPAEKPPVEDKKVLAMLQEILDRLSSIEKVVKEIRSQIPPEKKERTDWNSLGLHLRFPSLLSQFL